MLPSTGAMPVVAAGWLYSARGRSSIRGRNQKSPTATPSEGLAACASPKRTGTRTANVAAAISLAESALGNGISPHRDRHFELDLVGDALFGGTNRQREQAAYFGVSRLGAGEPCFELASVFV